MSFLGHISPDPSFSHVKDPVYQQGDAEDRPIEKGLQAADSESRERVYIRRHTYSRLHLRSTEAPNPRSRRVAGSGIV